jgi:hypothetical protein
LASWNRSGPLSRQAVWQAFVALPRSGGLLRPTTADPLVGPACSLPSCSCSTRTFDAKPAADLVTQAV